MKGKIISRRMLNLLLAVVLMSSLGFALATPASAEIPDCVNPDCINPPITVCAGTTFEDQLLIDWGVTCDPAPGTGYQGNGFTYDITIDFDFIQDPSSTNPSGPDLEGTAPTTAGTYYYHVYCTKDRYVDGWYDSCACSSVGYIYVKECVCHAEDITGICVGDPELTEGDIISMGNVSCSGEGCYLDHMDISAVTTAAAGSYPYTVYCYSQVCGMNTCTAYVYVDPCEEECECYAPDLVICEGDPLDDDLFIDAGAMCTGECDMTLDYSGVNNMVPGDYMYTVYCDTSVSCEGWVTVLPACVATAPDGTMCQHSSVVAPPGAGCSAGCDPDIDLSQVDGNTPGCYPYTVTCTDPCAGPCGDDMATGEICVIPDVCVDIIECPEGVIPVSSNFGVKAYIENCSDCILYDVTPHIIINGPAELVEDMPDHWNLGNMKGGMDADGTEVAWMLHCTEPGPVTVTVWVNECSFATCSFDQREPADLRITCDSPCEVCTNCPGNSYTVNARVWNDGDIDVDNAEAVISMPAGSPAVITPPKEHDLFTIPAGCYADTSWTVTPTGEGTITFTINAHGDDLCADVDVVAAPCYTTTMQKDVLVVVESSKPTCDPDAWYTDIVVSRLQPFNVRATVTNCLDTVTTMTATLNPPAGSQLVPGSVVTIKCDDWGSTVTKPAALSVVIDPTCDCCDCTVIWELECTQSTGGPVPVSVDVAAYGSTYSNVDCNPATVWQEEKVHLSATMGAFVKDCDCDDMVPIDAVAVCQDYDVQVCVINSGEADATDVKVDVNISGPTTCTGDWTLDFGTVAGLTTKCGWLSDLIVCEDEPLHCEDDEDVEFSVTDIRGIDENTCEPVLAENINPVCNLTVTQCEVTVDIVNPQTCDDMDEEQVFAVKALVQNCGTCTLEDVEVRLMMEGSVELVEGSLNPVIIPVVEAPDPDCDECCRDYYVTWMVQCTGSAGNPDEVYFDICVESLEPHMQFKSPSNEDADWHTVNVHQWPRDQAHVCVDILSPDTGSKYATSQDFAVTAVITNLECCAPITIDSANVEVCSIPWWEDGITIGDPLPPLPWVIAPGDTKTVTWTAHCEASGLNWFHVEIMGESDEYEPVYVISDPVSVWQYPAAHLEVEITEFPDTPIVTSTVFPVTAIITNTGEADATEVCATLSVEPEGSVRIAGPSEDGYTKCIGTLPGHNSEASSQTVTWNLHCKLPCDSTITVTVDGNDEYGWHMKQQCASTGSFVIEGGGEMVEGLFSYMPTPPDLGAQRGWFAGFFYGDANGLIGPFNATSPVSWAAMGGGPDYMGEVALMGAVLPNVSMTNAEWWLNCCCSDGEITCPCACELIEGRDVMVFIGHITSDTAYDMLPSGQDYYGVGPGLLQIINGQFSGSYLMHECGPDGVTWVKSLLGGEYCSNMAAEASRAIEARFIEPDSVTVKQLPMLTDLDIEKSADTCCYEMGEVAHFTVTLDNLGPSDATSVLVMDVLPEGLSYDGSSASQGWYDVTSGYWSVGDLASGNSATLLISAVVNTVGEVCNRATVVALDQHDPVTTNNSYEVCINATEPPDVTNVILGLDAGLNLISLPLIPDETNPEYALTGVTAITVYQYRHPEDAPPSGWVWYTNGTTYNPASGFVWGDGIGYWIDMAFADDLGIAGKELETGMALPPSYDVYGGWNLIGFKSTTAKLPTEYLAGIEGKYVMIYGYDNGAFHAVGSPGHAMLVPGLGYWLAVIDTKVGAEGTIFP